MGPKSLDSIEFSTFCVTRQREREILSRTARYCENTVYKFWRTMKNRLNGQFSYTIRRSSISVTHQTFLLFCGSCLSGKVKGCNPYNSGRKCPCDTWVVSSQKCLISKSIQYTKLHKPICVALVGLCKNLSWGLCSFGFCGYQCSP